MKITKFSSGWLVGLMLVSTINADQVWSGASTPNVLDENLLISGPCSMADNASISALTQDVTVTVATSGGDPIVRGADHVLELITAAGHEIIFSLTGSDDLAFEGGAQSGTAAFLRIIQRGGGTVRWAINGGRTVTLRNSTEAGATGGNGVQYFISMENATQSVVIQRADATKLHAGFIIENNSIVTFVAPTLLANSPTERGALVFDTGNTNTIGRTYVELGTQAGLIVSGHYVTNLTDPTAVAIDLAQPAGKEVTVKLAASSSAYASLLLINGNTVLPQLYCDPTRTGVYDGDQSGCIFGTNSTLSLGNNTYLDYVSTTTNVPALTSTSAVLNGRLPQNVLKERNASALIIDGAPTGTAGAVDARILMDGNSGIFVRSGADKNGTVIAQVDTSFSFTINPTLQPLNAGNIVFDVEGTLDILGTQTGTNVINVLSREVAPTGGYLEIGVSGAYFPKITFAADAHYPAYAAQYGKACCFINNRVNLSHAIIRHDDFVHVVNAVNTPYNSEPTYIGGDTFKLVQTSTIARPCIAGYNAALNLHTSAAVTGLDLIITNTTLHTANTSTLRFYQNGYAIDKGTGRALILGTNPGSYAYDYASVVDNASYLDINQTVNQPAGYTHQLNLSTAANDSTVIQGITGNISDQYSIHTLFLGNASNIQIGSQTAPSGVTLTTKPTLNIASNFFSFMSQGGTIGQPSLSATTGQGGMFVDINGTVQASASARAHFGIMVTQGDETAVITLPKSYIDFSPDVGIAYWALNLADKQTIVATNQTLAEFTIDWMNVRKDYAGGYVPFVPTGAIGTTISAANLYHIPVVKGALDHLQIKRSRIGDPIQIMIDGGNVRELAFLKGYDSAETATGIIAIKNDARIGLGNSQTRRESTSAAIVLGVNGITLVPDGNGVVDLNENLEINSVCHILAGPNFGKSKAHELHINANKPQEIRVKRGGTLDLSSFKTTKQRLVLCGNVQVLFEPGSRMLLGGGTVWFTNNSRLRIENEFDDSPTTGTSVASTNDFRVKFIGAGTIIFDENASSQIEKDSYLGIEWEHILASIAATNFVLSIRDNARVQIGTDSIWGGALQIGNTAHRAGGVSLTIELDGSAALLEINSQGFLGIGAGIVDKHQAEPNNWRVGSLHNVDQFKIHIIQGGFRHNNIVTGSSELAGLLAIGPATKYYLDIDHYSTFLAFGGGNMVRLNAGVTWQNPTVLDTASSHAGLCASLPLIKDRYNKPLIYQMETTGGTAKNFFDVMRTKDVNEMASPTANFAQLALGNTQMAYLWGTQIRRQQWIRILDNSGNRVAPEHSLLIGAVAINVNRMTGIVNNVIQILSNK